MTCYDDDMNDEQRRRETIETAMQTAMENLNGLGMQLMSPKTDLEMTIADELMRIMRQLSIIAAAMNITLEDD